MKFALVCLRLLLVSNARLAPITYRTWYKDDKPRRSGVCKCIADWLYVQFRVFICRQGSLFRALCRKTGAKFSQRQMWSVKMMVFSIAVKRRTQLSIWQVQFIHFALLSLHHAKIRSPMTISKANFWGKLHDYSLCELTLIKAVTQILAVIWLVYW